VTYTGSRLQQYSSELGKSQNAAGSLQLRRRGWAGEHQGARALPLSPLVAALVRRSDGAAVRGARRQWQPKKTIVEHGVRGQNAKGSLGRG
jgi:hypothetical protein